MRVWPAVALTALMLVEIAAALAQQPEVGCCGAGQAAQASRAADRAVAPRLGLEELKRLHLPDVRISSAVHQPQRDAGPLTAAHVKVDGFIGGNIGFELLLPDQWNGRFVMGGGGGYVGVLLNAARHSVNEGYATVGTDTGHQGPSPLKAGWALDNVEAQLNFGYLAVHRTAEVAKAIIHAYYPADLEYSYFVGCSRGGGQALMEAQRYPEDFDGVVSGAPAFDWTGLSAAMVYNAQHLFPDPNKLDEALLDEELLERLQAEILRQCDQQDGVQDGILDDPRQCRFDLSQVEGLTAAQRRAIEGIYGGPRNSSGQIYPGMPLGAEGDPGGWLPWITGVRPELLEQEQVPNLGFSFGTEFYKYFVFNDPTWEYSNYDFDNWKKDTHLAGTILNATDPDLSRFDAAGGKLILWHGWGDAALTALASIDYFEQVRRGDPDVREYFRLFLLPGVMHCAGGPGPDQVDWLATIVGWVERGEAPERVIARKRDRDGRETASRPLYPYPLRAVYRGSGGPNDAANYVLPEAR